MTEQVPKRRWFSFLRQAVVPLVKSQRELAFEAELLGRPLMDDEAFYHSNYAGTGIPRDIPLRLRRLIACQLGSPFERIQPADKPIEGIDCDFADIVFEVEEEFGVSIPRDEVKQLDGSFDSLVWCVAAKWRSAD